MAELAKMLADGEISTKIAHDIFSELFTSGASPKQYVADKGLAQISDSGALETAVLEVIAENPNEVEAYKGGKTKLISFFVGQVMRKTKGQANPGMVNQLIQKHLG
jgi:aspartyl/glutamyl-tRNA(Asn/Gln) amidotransferase subunit B (EC 6.3.5.-)